MGIKDNDSGYLDTKARIMAAIRGKGYSPPATQREPDPPAEAIPADEDSPDSEPVEEPTEQELLEAAGIPSHVAAAIAAPDEGAPGELPEVGADANGAPGAPSRALALRTDLLPPGAGVLCALEDDPGLYCMQSYLASRVSGDSKRTMLQSLQRVARMLNTTPDKIAWHKLRFQHTDAIRAKLLDCGYSRATVMMTLAGLKGVLRQAKRLGLMSVEDYDRATDWDPATGVSLPPGRELLAVDIQSIQAYLGQLEGTAYGAYLEAVFALCLGLGLRGDEASNVLTVGLDLGKATLKLLGKGHKEDEVPLGPAESRALSSWLAWRKFFERRHRVPHLLLRVQPNDTVMKSRPTCDRKQLEYLCRRVAREAGVKHFSPHDLRRTFCTRAIRESGGDLATVQRLMRHADIGTTKRYDRRSDEERHAARQKWTIWRPPEPVEPEPLEEPEPPESPPETRKPGFRLLPGGKT